MDKNELAELVSSMLDILSSDEIIPPGLLKRLEEEVDPEVGANATITIAFDLLDLVEIATCCANAASDLATTLPEDISTADQDKLLTVAIRLDLVRSAHMAIRELVEGLLEGGDDNG